MFGCGIVEDIPENCDLFKTEKREKKNKISLEEKLTTEKGTELMSSLKNCTAFSAEIDCKIYCCNCQ